MNHCVEPRSRLGKFRLRMVRPGMMLRINILVALGAFITYEFFLSRCFEIDLYIFCLQMLLTEIAIKRSLFTSGLSFKESKSTTQVTYRLMRSIFPSFQ